jgi:hypothetical protein
MSVLTSATRPHIPEDGILHSHGRENFKSYIAMTVKIDRERDRNKRMELRETTGVGG